MWSPEGDLYFLSARGGSANLWRVRLDSTSGKPSGPAESFTLPSSGVAHPSFSRDGKRLIWTSITREPNLQMITIDPATASAQGAEIAVTSGSQGDGAADVSPNGEWMAFVRRRVVHVSRRDRSHTRPVSPATANANFPRWSPDGTRIAFQADVDGKIAIWTVAPDGTELTRVAAGRTDLATPVWSPDGQRIAYTDFSASAPQVGVLTLSTARTEPLPTFGASRSFRPTSWSPDGERLAGYVRQTGGVVIYDFRRQAYEQLTDTRDGDSVWLDNRRLVFASDDDPGRLLVVDRVTRAIRRIEPWSSSTDPLGVVQLVRKSRQLFFQRIRLEADLWMMQRP